MFRESKKASLKNIKTGIKSLNNQLLFHKRDNRVRKIFQPKLVSKRGDYRTLEFDNEDQKVRFIVVKYQNIVIKYFIPRHILLPPGSITISYKAKPY